MNRINACGKFWFPMNKKMLQIDGCDFKLRLWHRKKKKVGRKIHSEGYTVKCGCCDEKIYISLMNSGSLEIGGVLASKEEWRKLLLPLLEDEDVKHK